VDSTFPFGEAACKAALLLLLCFVRDAWADGASAVASQGDKLFSGATALHGRLYTQSDEMPSAVVRCANCHSHGRSEAVAYTNAPRLTREWLVEDRRRRGGPKSHYDTQKFCALLRTGVGPDHIVINVEMPRYVLTDEECGSLWAFLTDKTGGE
jgi:hypothetical protein